MASKGQFVLKVGRQVSPKGERCSPARTSAAACACPARISVYAKQWRTGWYCRGGSM